MESNLVPKRQTPPIFYNVKTLESVTKKIIIHNFSYACWILKIGFQLHRETFDFSYRLKQISR